MNNESNYRLLFEAADDLLIFLDQQDRIARVNPALKMLLGHAPAEWIGRPFTELVYDFSPSGNVFGGRILMAEKLAGLRTGQKILPMRVYFESAGTEPRELRVKLDCDSAGPDAPVLVRAEEILDDISLKYCLEESQVYELGNNMREAELLRQRLTANLPRYLDSGTTMMISIGLQEMLMNAIEHGNLGITFAEKSAAMETYSLRDMVRERQRQAPFKQRKLRVRYSLSAKKIEYLIEDEGAGFDHRAMKARDIAAPGEVALSHGRGIKFAESAFDLIEYNEVGNQVRMIKHLE